MAKSENQSLQVAVILFAFITIALSVATFYFFNEATVNLENRLAADEKAEKADAFLKAKVIENHNLKQIIGVGKEMKFREIEKEKVELLLQLSAAMPDKDKLTLFESLKVLLSTVTFTKGQVTVARKDNGVLLARNKLDRDASIQREKVRTKAFDKRSKDVTKILKKRGEQEVKLIHTTNHLISIIKNKNQDYAKLVAEKVAELAEYERKVHKLGGELNILKTKQYEAQNWNFDRPDGRIVAVNVGQNSVWINIGRADELRLNIKFKVFKRGHDNVYQRQPKGAIEVTRFLGRGMAEARIITYKDEDPILDGDVIFTPIWSPGEPESFVLVGDFDLNGDKEPDNQLIRRLILKSGGVIEDKLSINTRYLLVGTPSKNDAGSVKTLTEEAEQKGIRIMSLGQFREYAGIGRWIHDLEDVIRNREAFKKDLFKQRGPRPETRRLEPGALLSGSSKERTSQPSRRSSSY